MLKQRVLTALALLPPVCGVIFFAPTFWLYVAFGAASLLMAWEWTALMGLTATVPRASYLALDAAMLAVLWLGQGQQAWIFAAASAVWTLALLLLALWPGRLLARRPAALPMAVLGLVMIPPAVLALAMLHARGLEVLLFGLTLVWVADIGAYFAGRGFGRHKLSPLVSPGKTIEGAFGGLALCALWAWAWSAPLSAATSLGTAALVLVSLIVAVYSIVGDLSESLFKRLAGVKDSGTLLPGHGGVLDRVDSLLAAMPLLAFSLILLGD